MTPGPLFFLVRPGLEQITPNGQVLVHPGTAVPLIPTDMLPEWLEIIGVPRYLSQEQTEDMINLGPFHAEAGTYQLKFASVVDDGEKEQLCSDDDASTTCPSKAGPGSSPPSSEIGEPEEKTKPTLILPAPKKLKPAQGLASSRHNPLNNSQDLEHMTTTSPTPVPTSPCRHWCRYGACRWGLSCRFKHAMPTTPEGLAEVGLETFPDWWLQARGVMPMPPEVIRAAETRKSGKKKQKQKVVVPQRQVGDGGQQGQKVVNRPAVDANNMLMARKTKEARRVKAVEGLLIDI
ncbi:hypothetical protein BHE90_015137 [Fusarium euwallaceae]|uniref:C3H1-type domain-containing protein n=1 Tax=Fusarium euwallaceae TaxID=1147111 RepID=A0A430L473_9HYPO|nr:hypothetical protein BHE90_015137 [Fusarium euwallaceae]